MRDRLEAGGFKHAELAEWVYIYKAAFPLVIKIVEKAVYQEIQPLSMRPNIPSPVLRPRALQNQPPGATVIKRLAYPYIVSRQRRRLGLCLPLGSICRDLR